MLLWNTQHQLLSCDLPGDKILGHRQERRYCDVQTALPKSFKQARGVSKLVFDLNSRKFLTKPGD